MANVLGIIGYNKQGSTSNKILAAFGNDIIDIATGTGYPLNLATTDNVEFEVFLDRVFVQNNDITPKSFYGTSWTNKHLKHAPRSKFIKKFKNRLYLANCQFTQPGIPNDPDGNYLKFPSRVFYSDLYQGGSLLESGQDLTWGLDWGRGGNTEKNSNRFYLTQQNEFITSDFIASNIKVGDPLFIVYVATIANQQYLMGKIFTVKEVKNSFELILNEDVKTTEIDGTINFWVGSNWFDVGTDDNDQVTALGENSDRLLIFKLMSLWFYSGNLLRQVKRAKGTSSARSILNDDEDNTYYFHGSNPKISGIYMYNGVSSSKISRAIDPYIKGMSTSNYTQVVGWREGNELRWYLGNLSNSNENISMTNAVATLNVDTQTWDVSPINDVITCSTHFRVSNQDDTYCGTSDNEVLKMDSGNDFNGNPIPMALETKVFYPSGTEVINEFPYIQVISRNAKGIKIKYKLWNHPSAVDDNWLGLGEVTDDLTELTLPLSHQQSAGIQLRVEEDGNLENDALVEKISIFYKPNRTRLL